MSERSLHEEENDAGADGLYRALWGCPGGPRTLSRDSTLALLSEGYAFIPERCERYGSNVLET